VNGHPTAADPARIGGFLVGIGAMKTWQVDDVLETQRAGDRRLFGEIAIERAYINDSALKWYVDTCRALGAAARPA